MYMMYEIYFFIGLSHCVTCMFGLYIIKFYRDAKGAI